MQVSLPWFEAILVDIKARILADRFPHAVLAIIPEGWGSGRFLTDLAAIFLELERIPAELRELAHPDFLWVQSRDKDGDWVDAIQIDAIRQLGEFVTQRAVRSSRKLAVLPAAHNMNTSAANALLKSLEEPASACCLVLETPNPAQLPATIRSRCQRLDMRFARSAAVDWLQREGFSDAVPLLDLTGGGPLDALEVLRDGESNIRVVLDRLEDRNARHSELDRLAQDNRLHVVLNQWYRLLPQLLVAATGSRQRHSLLEFADELAQCRYQVSSVRGANVRLLLDRLAYLWDAARSA